MPPITPTGGLSVIAHLVVNILTFFLRIIKKFLHKKYNRATGKPLVHHFVSEEGDTRFRRGFAYTTITIIFMAVISTGYLIVRVGVNL